MKNEVLFQNRGTLIGDPSSITQNQKQIKCYSTKNNNKNGSLPFSQSKYWVARCEHNQKEQTMQILSKSVSTATHWEVEWRN